MNHDAPRRKIVGETAIELDVVDRRRTAVEAHSGGKGRLHAGHPLLALERFEHRRLFAADIGPGAVMDVEIEWPAVNIVLADEPRVVGLCDRGLEMMALLDEFAAHVDIGRVRAHGERCHERALDQRVRVVAHDLAVLAGARLGFVGVDGKIVRTLGIDGLGHERPFEPGREARASTPAQARGLHFSDDPVAPLVEDRLGPVPIAARPRALEATIAEPIEIGEDAILVFQHRSVPDLLGRRLIIRGRRRFRRAMTVDAVEGRQRG